MKHASLESPSKKIYYSEKGALVEFQCLGVLKFGSGHGIEPVVIG